MSSDLAAIDHKPWWKGARGEWFVVAQVVLIGLVFLGPRTVFGQPAWRPHLLRFVPFVGLTDHFPYIQPLLQHPLAN
jgi:hypothetical protein